MSKLMHVIAAMAFAIALVVGVPGSQNVSATEEDTSKVTICHRTNSATNPYVKISVDQDAVNGEGNNDHTHHTGPIATSVSAAQNLKDQKIKWGDIIPDGPWHPGGLNWDSVGQDVHAEGCLGGDEIEEAVPAAVTFTNPTCEDKGTYTIPSTEHVTYKINGQTVAAGTYNADNGTTVTVTAVTEQGFFIPDNAADSWTKTFNAPTNCDEDEDEGVVLGAVTQVPAGGVDAGVGGAASASLMVPGLVSSIAVLGYGFMRLRSVE